MPLGLFAPSGSKLMKSALAHAPASPTEAISPSKITLKCLLGGKIVAPPLQRDFSCRYSSVNECFLAVWVNQRLFLRSKSCPELGDLPASRADAPPVGMERLTTSTGQLEMGVIQSYRLVAPEVTG